jgi:hypothetical protein
VQITSRGILGSLGWRVHSSPPDHQLEAEMHAWWLRHGAGAPPLLAR